jgi:demethylmenaquinone methyltransferase/2-methoxy-6-polyprenyl-1,4-benzoquinol methylase
VRALKPLVNHGSPPSRDPQAVRAMFDRLAARYDLANHVLSVGLDFWWRHRACEIVRRWNPKRVLDVATGSGDLSLAIARKLPQAEVTGADFSSEMLARARAKGLKNTVVADALALPFAEETFDCVTVAFGLRNMADWGAALREMRRLLVRDGHLLILDFSLPALPVRNVYRFYLHKCVPAIAGLVTGEEGAYEYLGASIETFPCGAEMSELIDGNGFKDARAIPLTGGIVTIYTAVAS